MTPKPKHGGARPNSGPKPKPDKLLFFYIKIRKNVAESYGGLEIVQKDVQSYADQL